MKRIILIDYSYSYYYPTIDIELAKWILEQYKRYIDVLDTETDIYRYIPFNVYAVLNKDIIFNPYADYIIEEVDNDKLFKMSPVSRVVFTVVDNYDNNYKVHVGIYDDDKDVLSKTISIDTIRNFVNDNKQ